MMIGRASIATLRHTGIALAITVGATAFFACAPSTPAQNADGYVENLPGVRTGMVDRQQRIANTAAINDFLARGGRLHLHSGTRVEIASTLKIPSGGAIIGDAGAAKPIIFMPANAFDNQVDVVDKTRYGLTAVGIDFSGEMLGSLRPSSGVTIENLRLVSESRPGRRLRGIVGRNVVRCVIRNVEISDFPMAIGIALASARGCRLSNIFVHDFYDDTPWRQLAQSTGIEIDNDEVQGIPSSGNIIDSFRIERIRVGGALLTKWGYQTDGINVFFGAHGTQISNGRIADVGEGIDTFGSDGTTSNVTIDRAYIFGLKFIHGASHNRASHILINDAGLAAVNFSGSDQASQDTFDNSISDLTISNIDAAGTWRANSTAGILISGKNARRRPVDNRVSHARIDLGPNGKYGWLDGSTGSGNIGVDVRIRGGSSLDRPVLVLYGGGAVR